MISMNCRGWHTFPTLKYRHLTASGVSSQRFALTELRRNLLSSCIVAWVNGGHFYRLFLHEPIICEVRIGPGLEFPVLGI